MRDLADNKIVDLSKFHNVAIYIDYENIYKILLKEHTNLIHIGFFEHMQAWCEKRHLRIVKTVAYCNFDNRDLHDSFHQTLLQEYGVSTVHTSNRGKNYADLQISIDAINDMYLNSNIDEFIIISNDKDMSPLLSSIKSNKRKVSLITAGELYDHAICNVPDEHYNLFDIIGKSSVKSLYIGYIQEKVYENLSKFLNDILLTPMSFKKRDYVCTLSNHVRHFSLMEYEMLSIYKNLYKEGKFLIYRYTYRDKDYYGIITIDVQQILINNSLLEENDFVSDFDFDIKIEESYNNFL